MRRSKEDIIIICFAVTLILVIFGIAYVLFTSQEQPAPDKQILAPTPVQTTPTQPTEDPEATPSEDAETVPLVQFDQQTTATLLERVENKQPLSENDSLAKARMLALLDEPSGYLYQTERVYIEYVNSADAIMVEIRTSNIDQAKAEAVVWLQSQGMSRDGICNYPVQFYLNYDVMQFLSGSNIIFSPLAPGCN